MVSSMSFERKNIIQCDFAITSEITFLHSWEKSPIKMKMIYEVEIMDSLINTSPK